MHPVLLGILLGISNVIANAMLFGALDDPRGAGVVFVYGILPGICVGSILGAVAGGMRDSHPALRLAVVLVPAAGVVAMLGTVFELPRFIPYALVPTILYGVLLEWRTRGPEPSSAMTSDGTDGVADGVASADAPIGAALLADARARNARSGVKLAMLLGAVVMFIVMAGVGAGTHPQCSSSHAFEHLLAIYLPWGAGVGVGLAAPFGVLAECTVQRPVWMRRALLLILGFALTAALGTLVRLDDMILVAFIPTAAGCLLLERYTRLPPAVPAAIARV